MLEHRWDDGMDWLKEVLCEHLESMMENWWGLLLGYLLAELKAAQYGHLDWMRGFQWAFLWDVQREPMKAALYEDLGLRREFWLGSPLGDLWVPLKVSLFQCLV